MMNPEIKKRWLESLRSGEYTQGKKKLRHADNTFCCLGVLCDLRRKDMNEQWEADQYCYSYRKHTGYLPDDVKLWSGLDECKGAQETLARMNDNGFTFNEIANYIETNL